MTVSKINAMRKERLMRLSIAVIAVIFLVLTVCGCENVSKNLRQTGKNMNALFLDGYDRDLYGKR